MPSTADTPPESSSTAGGTIARADRALSSAATFEENWAAFNQKFDDMMRAFAEKMERSVVPDAPEGVPDILTTWHGLLGDPTWPAPRCVAQSTTTARPGYSDMDSSEYADTPAVLKAKIKIVASMIRASKNTVVYTGAGISTAAGVADYASRADGSVAVAASVKASGAPVKGAFLQMKPTVAHQALAALERADLVHFWLQQNHDALAQKAGFPQEKVCEIHGSWHDRDANPVVKMSGSLRPDLARWMIDWEKRAEVVVALGSSLCGMASDCVARASARRFLAGYKGAETKNGSAAAVATAPPTGGLIIANLQRTPMDGVAAVRIFGKLDLVMTLLAMELGVEVTHREPVPVPKDFFFRPEGGEAIPDTRPKRDPAVIAEEERISQQEAALSKLKLSDAQRQKIMSSLAETMQANKTEAAAATAGSVA